MALREGIRRVRVCLRHPRGVVLGIGLRIERLCFEKKERLLTRERKEEVHRR